ncbi:hypothetical protein TIFTF001_024317 [Ficus carica]|uniref:F-box protein At3g26010-like beta-propeller domain-containing protein n=1 Tax=Ficus carica TaxID=3494 RepID=A0AA88AN54_FICCA|nr:hypothetical protein TIFTF001_024317 [Ficus carica]
MHLMHPVSLSTGRRLPFARIPTSRALALVVSPTPVARSLHCEPVAAARKQNGLDRSRSGHPQPPSMSSPLATAPLMFSDNKRMKESEGESEPSSSLPLSSSAASKFMNGAISDNLLLEIFIRLANCLTAIQCSCVCKLWYCLISNPQFIHRFIIRNRNNSRRRDLQCTFICQFPRQNPRIRNLKNETLVNYQAFSSSESSKGLPSNSLPYNRINFLPIQAEPLIIRSSCNDLLLVSSYPPPSTNYYICNPFTKQWIQLPQPPSFYYAPLRFGLSTHEFSGGPQQTRFRAVLIGITGSSPNGPTESHVQIFSSDTWSWTYTFASSSHPLRSYTRYSRHTEVIVCIVALDPFDEMSETEITTKQRKRWHCRVIDPPAELAGRATLIETQVCLGACQGRLQICSLTTFQSGTRKRVWELEEDNDDCNNNYSWRMLSEPRFPSLVDEFLVLGKVSDELDLIIRAVQRLMPFRLVQPFWPTPLPTIPSSV